MSKSKKRRAEKVAARRAAQGLPVGDMLTRISDIAKVERETGTGYKGSVTNGWYRHNGEITYDPNLDSRRNGNGQIGRQIFYATPKKDEETFHCESAEIEGKCPIMQVPEVHVPYGMWDTFIELADSCDTEWLALLLGRLNVAENRYEVTGFYFPPQTATGTSVDVPTNGPDPRPGTIGAIHSHVKMQAFWSSTDKAHSNWPLEIVINARGEYAALVRFQLKCGGYTKQDSKVMLEGERPDPLGWTELSQAFAQGARLARTKGSAKEDSSEIPIKVPVQTALSLVGGNGGMSSGANSLTDTVPDDGSAAHEPPDQTQECYECKGVGLVDPPVNEYGYIGAGIFEPDICGKCNGWGRLLNGQAISAQAPPDLTRVQ